MNEYSYGTSAYKIDTYYEKNEENEARTKRAKARRNMRTRRRIFAAVFAVFAVACIILYRNVLVIEASSSVNLLSTQLNDLRGKNIKRAVELEKSVDLKKVEGIAVNKLGMKRPDKHQTVYVDVTQSDYAEVAKSPETEGKFYGTFSVMQQGMHNVLEYLQ